MLDRAMEAFDSPIPVWLADGDQLVPDAEPGQPECQATRDGQPVARFRSQKTRGTISLDLFRLATLLREQCRYLCLDHIHPRMTGRTAEALGLHVPGHHCQVAPPPFSL